MVGGGLSAVVEQPPVAAGEAGAAALGRPVRAHTRGQMASDADHSYPGPRWRGGACGATGWPQRGRVPAHDERAERQSVRDALNDSVLSQRKGSLLETRAPSDGATADHREQLRR